MVPILMPCSLANSSSSGRRDMVPSSFMISQITPLGSKPPMRARSQAASVWPARASTPPGWAISGKIWPGLTISSALALFAAAACTVRARSAAEIPVVTPSAASMETVNLVPKPEPLRGAISGSLSSSQRSRVMGMQIRPRAKRAMKLMCSAVTHSEAMMMSPSFSRSSSSIRMTILPARMSSISSAAVFRAMRAISLIQVAVFGKKTGGQARGGRFSGFVTEQQALQVTREQIHFEVDLTTRAVVEHDGFGQGVRHDGQLKFGAVDRIDGQARAVDGDRAFVGDVLGQFAWCTNGELPRPGILRHRDDLTDTVNMPTDQVTTQAAGGCQGLFQVDLATGLEVDKRGTSQGFAADISPKTIARQLNCSQAHAVDRNAVAQLDVCKVKLAGFHIHPHIATLRCQGTDTANSFDYAGKHATPCIAATAKHWRTTPVA